MNIIRQGKLSKRLVLGLAALFLAVAPLLNQTFAYAATVTSRKDTLSTSAPNTAANHTIQFVTPTGVTNGQTITLDFDTQGTPDQFNLGSVAFGDVDVAEDTDGSPASCSGTLTDETLAASQGASAWGVGVNTSTDTITLTAPSNAATYIAAGACIVIEIGTNATSGATGTNQITNPAKVAAAGTADTYDIVIGGSFGDTGTILVAIQDQVGVSATIAETLTFTIAGVSGATCQTSPDSGTPTQIAATATAVPFGTIATPNTFYAACQDLAVTTNAANGYIVTAEENTSLKSGANLLADTSCDSSCNHNTGTSGTTWATATNNGLGFWCDNRTNTPCISTANSTSLYKRFACTGTAVTQCSPGGAESAQTVLTQTGPANNDVGRIHYKLSYSGTQAAGTYTNLITYIATPTY